MFIDYRIDATDLDYFRTHIAFVNHVRLPQDAQVYVLITRQATGAGGAQYTLGIIGRGEFEGNADTLRYVASPASTQDERREGLTRMITLGLARYVARTPLADRLTIGFDTTGTAGEVPPPARDPWNSWVFRLAANSYLHGEKSSHSLALSSSVSANRTTETWKLAFVASGGYSRNTYQLDDTTTVVSENHNYGLRSLVVRSVGRHWGIGATASANSATFFNQDLALRAAPAVEYNVFPYSESTWRLLSIRYAVGLAYFTYHDVTIYNRTSETRPQQVLTVAMDVRQPWGTAGGSLEGATYLNDWSRNHLDLNGSLDLRVFRGLSLSLYGGAALIHDQLYLPRAGATAEEVLTQQRQLATSYRYSGAIGLSYTFGSIFNNIVNPRFGQYF